MSAQNYFHEKAAESRHNETIAYVMFLAGSVFFVGGMLSALISVGEPSWFLFVPYNSVSTQAFYLEVAFLMAGLFMMAGGLGFGLYLNHDRSFYLQELCDSLDSDCLVKEFRSRSTVVVNRKKKH